MASQPRDQHRSFSLNDGGPFHLLMKRLHLIRPSGMVRSARLALFAWLPVVLAEGARAATGGRPDLTLYDLSMHTRLLVAMPMVLFAERIVEVACRSAIRTLYDGRFCDERLIDRVVDSGERLRDARWPEVALAAIALVGGQLALRVSGGATGLFHGGTGAGAWSFPRMWYLAIALPLWQFVMLRWLWRWLIWSYMLARFARLPLAPIATHPDKAAGLGALSRPVSGFGAFAFGAGAVLAGAWATQLLAHRATPQTHWPSLLVYLITTATLALGPLLFFSGHLFRARRRALAEYGDFTLHYMRGFHDKWIVRGTGDQ